MSTSEEIKLDVINYFSGAVNKGGVSHAYLLSGGSADFRKELAYEIAAFLNCLNPAKNNFCGRCESCIKIKGESHPDIYIVETEGSSIKIDVVRKLQKDLGYKKYEGKYKIIIIAEASKMTTQAANSLLKILEEPLDDTIFLLLTAQKHNLLPTIISRCQNIYLGLSDEFSPLEGFNEYILKILAGDKFEVLHLAEEISKKDNPFLEQFLHNLLQWYRDCIVWEETDSEKLLINTAWLNSIEKACLSLTGLLQALDAVVEAQKNIQSNANKNLVLENLFLKLVALK